jgi:hypothetical protein
LAYIPQALRELAFDSNNGNIYVADIGTVSVIDGARLLDHQFIVVTELGLQLRVCSRCIVLVHDDAHDLVPTS